jgi:hypothetical protein
MSEQDNVQIRELRGDIMSLVENQNAMARRMEERHDTTEKKLDKLTDAVTRLVVVEERQTTQGQRIGKLEERTAVVEAAGRETDKKLDKWIYMGMGAWGLAAVLFAIFSALKS